MIITRKVEIIVVNEGEEKDKAWQIIREYNRITPIASNLIVNHIFFNEVFQERLLLADNNIKEKINNIENKIHLKYEEIRKINKKIKETEDCKKGDDLKNKKKKLEKEIEKYKNDKKKVIKDGRKEAKDIAEKVFNTSLSNSIYQLISDKFPQMPDAIKSPLTNSMNFIRTEIFDVKQGNKTLRTYKKGMPFPIRGRDLTFIKEGKDIHIKWIRGSRGSEEYSLKNQIEFKIFFGRDKSNNREIINRVLEGEYEVKDSSIQLDKKKLFLLLCVDIPIEKHEFDKNKVLGVDLGVKVPAYISTNIGYFRQAIGSADELLKTRMQFQKRYKQLQKSLKYTKGGHGREKKLKALNQLKNKENNWVTTYNHKISSAIIKYAVKERCHRINLEFLKGYGQDAKNKFILRNWSYYQLQKFIIYKASKHGIEVKFIDPYHTSQTCSVCGHYEEGQRETQETFICKNPNCKNYNESINADYNASKNIANSTKFVNSKEECEFYKKNKVVDPQ